MSPTKQKLPLKITKPFDYSFTTSQPELYAIFVLARCKSKKQIKSNVDEDLRVEINGLKFREIPPEKNKQLFNIPASFNGSKLKGLKKTVVFLTVLTKGNHIVSLIPKNSAYIEEIKIQRLDGKEEITLDLNEQAEDGNRRPWFTFVLIDLPLKIFSADVTVKWRWRDSDDVKLIIDNEIKKNNLSVLHKNWLWSANIFKKLLKKERQKKTFEENLAKGIHYLEFWADRTPILHQVVVNLGKVKPRTGNKGLRGKIVLYQDIEVTNFVNIRSAPKRPELEGMKNNIIGQLRDGELVEIIEKEVEKEYVQNKSNIWHKIRYEGKEAYILSSFVEIEGQERTRVIEKIKVKANAEGIDKNFAVVLAGCESRFKPYAVSETGARGIYQLTTIARQDLEKRFDYKITEKESFDIDKNIEAGLRYLKWLISVYQGTQDEYKKIIAAWNVGQSLIPVKGKINYDNIQKQKKKEEVKNLVGCVETNRKKRNWKYITSFVFLLFILSGAIFTTNQVLGNEVINKTRFKFYNPYPEIENIEVTRISKEPTEWQTIVQVKTRAEIYRQEYPGFLENAYLFDINFNGYPELFIVDREGKQIVTRVLRYSEQKKSLQLIKFIEKDGKESTSSCCSYIVFKPFKNGVQYDLAIHVPNYETETYQYIGTFEVVYQYDFLNNSFYEREKNYIPYIPGG